MQWLRNAVCLFVAVGAAQQASAVIVYNDSDGQTTAPSGGDPTVGGWAYVGSFAGSSAVAIGPNHFIASQHQGGGVGGTLELNGNFYTTVSSTNIANSDLRVWEVSGTIPQYAPLYTANPTAASASLVGYGRNTLGTAVTTPSPAPNDHGWQWGATAGKSWGTNTVDARVESDGLQLLRFDFDPIAGEATVAANDSGGGLFINDGGVWKLAGVHYAVESQYNYLPQDGGMFNAAIYAGEGLYIKSDEGWVAAPARPQFAYSSDISYYAADIQAAVPEPTSLALLAMGGTALMIRRRRRA